MSDHERVLRVILEALDDINASLPPERQINISPDAVLFGPSGSLDSIGLVNLIVTVEQGISEEFGVSVVLADEKAMSRRTSPFRTVQTLRDHVISLLEGRVHAQ